MAVFEDNLHGLAMHKKSFWIHIALLKAQIWNHIPIFKHVYLG